MRLAQLFIYVAGVTIVAGSFSCTSKTEEKAAETGAVEKQSTIKGVYTLEPGVKTFVYCGQNARYWVADSSAQLELQYAQQIPFEQQGQPVYVELEGSTLKSAPSGDGAAYDSTLIVKKLIKLSKDIPANCK